jgi:hypothetical protein
MPKDVLLRRDPESLGPSLTLREARQIGRSAERLASIRPLLQQIKEGQIKIDTEKKTYTLPLTADETQALLAFLCERYETFLTSYDVGVDE